MKRSFLVDELGLEKEMVDKIFAEHGKTIQKEKEKVEELESQLQTAQEAITKATESKESLEQIKAELNEYKEKYDNLSETYAQERKTQQIKEALTKASGSDLDYLIFKLGEVDDLDTLDDKINSLKEQYPQHFESSESAQTEKEDVEVVENKLEKGGNNRTFSLEEIGNLSQDEINENWELIAESLKNQ